MLLGGCVVTTNWSVTSKASVVLELNPALLAFSV